MHADTNFVVAKGHERTLDHPEVFQSESFDLCDEICLFLRRTHRRLHLAAANGWTLRPHSGAKNPPSVDATFHEGKLASAAERDRALARELEWGGVQQLRINGPRPVWAAESSQQIPSENR